MSSSIIWPCKERVRTLFGKYRASVWLKRWKECTAATHTHKERQSQHLIQISHAYLRKCAANTHSTNRLHWPGPFFLVLVLVCLISWTLLVFQKFFKICMCFLFVTVRICLSIYLSVYLSALSSLHSVPFPGRRRQPMSIQQEITRTSWMEWVAHFFFQPTLVGHFP